MHAVLALDSRYYPSYARYWDHRVFRELILKHIEKNSIVLDLGAGSGFAEDMHFRGVAAHICGLDPEHSVLLNPHLDEAKIGSGEHIPWADESFDVVFAHNVLEHLSAPEAVLREVWRVLKPGGCFLVKTPNRFHYVTLIAQLTPTSFHKYFNRLRGRDEVHTFKTHYRLNSKKAIARLAKKCQFELEDLRRIEGRPEYLRFSVPSYYFGLAWERLVNRYKFLEPFRVLIIAVLRKPLAAQQLENFNKYATDRIAG
ncbi:MAG TPA: class I SAM-dependent methyltransferase [Dongiaceae bacterium]|nr:class I SAM-dependent methyltransferase [Dongiaceae bacterium]